MNPYIEIKKIWSDDDILEFEIIFSDGQSLFTTTTYLGYSTFDEAVEKLDKFKEHFYGGICDMEFGAFGEEYANGAIHMRFHFPKPGNLYITVKGQSDFKDFSMKKVASECTLYIKSEAGLLDTFISELKSIQKKYSEEAKLKGI